MKFVSSRYMILLIIAFFISCGTVHKDAAPAQVLTDIEMAAIPIITPDTIQKDTLPPKASPQSKKDFEVLSTKTDNQPKLPVDSIVSLNYQWQKAYLRTVNRSVKRSDSLAVLINKYGKRANEYFDKAQKAQYYIEQTKHAEVSSNWVFYVGMFTLLFFVIANTVLTYKIKKQTA